MSLRFAIIKHVKTLIGKNYEDVVYEYHEDKVHDELLYHFMKELPHKRLRQVYNSDEIATAFEAAWKRTVEEFKKVTITIW